MAAHTDPLRQPRAQQSAPAQYEFSIEKRLAICRVMTYAAALAVGDASTHRETIVTARPPPPGVGLSTFQSGAFILIESKLDVA